jgi:hypothetical protein
LHTPPAAPSRHALPRHCCHNDHFPAQWNRWYTIFGNNQGERRLHSLPMGIASGALPAGVGAKASSTTTSLNLTGTPTTAATYSFTVKVTRCHGGTSQMAYKVVIQASANHVVDLSWNASTSSNVTGYNLYRSLDGATWNKINASLIPSTLYADSTVANGSTYYYAATAVDIYGHESSKTAPIKVAIP